MTHECIAAKSAANTARCLLKRPGLSSRVRGRAAERSRPRDVVDGSVGARRSVPLAARCHRVMCPPIPNHRPLLSTGTHLRHASRRDCHPASVRPACGERTCGTGHRVSARQATFMPMRRRQCWQDSVGARMHTLHPFHSAACPTLIHCSALAVYADQGAPGSGALAGVLSAPLPTHRAGSKSDACLPAWGGCAAVQGESTSPC